MADLIKTFSETGTWVAKNAAEEFLQLAGFSVGANQAHSPRGILFGDYAIMKWRNLRRRDIAALHGVMTGDGREGPLVVRIFERAPQEAKRAFHRQAALYSQRAA
jgi:hypothetical protein